MTDPIEVRVQVHGIYDPYSGRWDDWPAVRPATGKQRKRESRIMRRLVLATVILGAVAWACAIAWGLP